MGTTEHTAKASRFPRLFISADHGGAGKTLFSIGLMSALTRKGLIVQPFKKGPDFIDPMWHAIASGRTSRNLDFFMMADAIRPSFLKHSAGADLSIIEGNKGLFDGISADGSDSSSALARHLEAPVVLVVDTAMMTRGVAPLLLGYLNFERDLNIAGVILNNVAGARHESKLRAAVERYTSIRILGALPRNPDLGVAERYLGLITSDEDEESERRVRTIGDQIQSNVDVEAIIKIAKSAPVPSFHMATPTEPVMAGSTPQKRSGKVVRIGVARDRAFNFYYPENIEALRALGAQIVYFSPIVDTVLPDVDALYIGGGFPEIHASALESNSTLRGEVRSAIEDGMPVYAECGGLIYLSRSVRHGGRLSEMVGALPVHTEMEVRPVGRGYMTLATRVPDRQSPSGRPIWEMPENILINAHEFHHARSRELSDDLHYLYEVQRGFGVDGGRDGIVFRNVLASYAHIHAEAAPWWAEMFVKAVLRCKKADGVRASALA
jgi:cobyrinic acid a,c-diamide synthase